MYIWYQIVSDVTMADDVTTRWRFSRKEEEPLRTEQLSVMRAIPSYSQIFSNLHIFIRLHPMTTTHT